MNLKNIILVLALVVRVRSDCGDYFTCLSGFVKDYLSGNATVNRSDGNEKDVIDVDDLKNKSVGLFDLSDVGRSLSQALTDVTTLIKDEFKGIFNIDEEVDVNKAVENRTEIHVKAFSLSKTNESITSVNSTASFLRIPDVIVNNLTKFNDELNALKVEIEKNLQAELESFISQILENDTVDWVEVTEDSSESELTTTLKPYPDFEKAFVTTTGTIDNNIDNGRDYFTHEPNEDDKTIITSTTLPLVNNVTTIAPAAFDVTHEEKSVSEPKSDTKNNSTDTSIKEVTKTNQSVTVAPSTNRNAVSTIITTTTTVKAVKEDIVTTTVAPFTTKKEITIATTATAKAIKNKTVTTSVPPLTTKKEVTITKTTKPKAIKDYIVTTTVAPSTTKKEVTTTKTTKPKAIKDYIVTTTVAPFTTKKESTTLKSEVSTENQQIHTKSPIDYKFLENFKVNEISGEDSSYYEIIDDNVTDYPIIDYVDLYKDTTNEELDYVPTVRPNNEIKSDLENVIQNGDNADNSDYTKDTTHPASVFPWLAAIFIKSGNNNQFDYYCDGTLLSNKAIFTAARCLQRANETVNADDVIVFLGKRSLQSTADGESIHKIKQVILHPNFSLQENTAQNDLAVLLLEDAAVLSDRIQPACLIEDRETGDAVATAWGESLSLIRFVEKNHTCAGEPVNNTFCATYGASVALCPSYGGVYASLQEGRWCAGGVRAGDVTRRGLCFDKIVAYTDLRQYTQWLKDIVQ